MDPLSVPSGEWIVNEDDHGSILGIHPMAFHSHGRLGEAVPAVSRPSFPVWRAPDVGPFLVGFRNPRPDRVFPDIDPFVRQILVAPDPVIEEVALPIDSEFPGGEALPVSDGFFHPVARFPIESDEGMQMIRHEQDDGGVPCLPLVLKTEGLENPIGGFPLGKLRESAFRAIDGDEKCGGCANPGGRMMDPAPDFPNWFPVFIHFPKVGIGYGEVRCKNAAGMALGRDGYPQLSGE
jgi:hypothetical protein